MLSKDTKFHCKFNHAPITQIQKQIVTERVLTLLDLVGWQIRLVFLQCMTTFSAPHCIFVVASANWQQCEKIVIDVSFHQKMSSFDKN